MVTVNIVSRILDFMAGHILSEVECKEVVMRLISSGPEDEVLEFKEKKNGFDKDELGQYYSALANEATLRNKECAWILFGVKNDRSIIGTTVLSTKDQISSVKLDISNFTTNRAGFIEIYVVKIDNKRVVLFQIPQSPGVVMTYKGTAYGREGESLVGLSVEKINRIQFRNIDRSAEVIDRCSRFGCHCIRQAHVFREESQCCRTSRTMERRGVPFPSESDGLW